MLTHLVTIPGLLAVVGFVRLVGAVDTTVHISPRAGDYVWTLTWTAPRSCPSWPCTYSYEVSAPSYSSAEGSIPPFDASCQGTVDQPLKACTLLSNQGDSAAAAAISGNFSTYETSGVGSGLITIIATWLDQTSGTTRKVTGVTPMQASDANNNTWDVYPEGSPITDTAPNATATRSRRRVLREVRR
ncbi:hypothetical protein F5Y19DRAFT_72475 [Xylariaceae sp. FL1651]|nr:hypothetical protein F5Y19DRAFT_72475 [Xylariaceae sp. FL1651]